jgi:hypothetical protein
MENVWKSYGLQMGAPVALVWLTRQGNAAHRLDFAGGSRQHPVESKDEATG